MRQGTRVAATTDIRRLLHALRPVLVLGGFVVVWWCLATGTAQASDGPHHDLGTTTKALGATADRVVHRTTDRAVHHAQRPAQSPKAITKVAPKVTQTVRHHVAPVRAVVAKTVEQGPAKPVVKTVAAQVTPVLEKAESALSTTPVGSTLSPVVEDAASATQNLPLVGESASLQGETRSSQVTEQSPPAATSLVAADGFASHFTSSPTTAHTDQDRAAPSSPVGPRGDDHGFIQTGSTGSSSAQSGSGPAPGAVLCGTGTVIAPSASKTSINAPAGRPTAGPAYPPSSSPD